VKKLAFFVCSVFAISITTELPAAFITATGRFTETNTNDVSGDLFSIANTSDLGSKITSISFQLASNLAFDVDGGAPNPGSPFEVVSSVPGGTVSSSLSDDLTRLTLDFTDADFAPGEVFEFTIDVDRTLGSGPGQKLVMGHMFAGTIFTVTFDGPEGPFTLSSSFARLIEEGRVFPFDAVASVSQQFEIEAAASPSPISNPEPSSWIMFTLGAFGLGYVSLKRKRS
jgi:hypothetical protein